jgi:TonB-linked SusC/RagA family outer membrane protein
MKLTAILLFITVMQVTAEGTAQTVTLNVRNVGLKAVFKEMQKQTGLSFVFYEKHLADTKPVSVTLTNSPLKEALATILADQPLTFEIDKNSVTISRKVTSPPPVSPPQSKDKIKGKVTDEANQPISGATVKVKGTDILTITDDEGNFSLNGVEGDAILIITYVGYQPMELSLSGREMIAARLKIAIGELTEVQVSTGYQYVPRERATGSFNHVDNKLINRSVSTGIIDRIENLVPGVLFNRGDAIKTDPLLIRGRSTIFADAKPLIVINNFPYDGDLNNLNPNDIESIDILKDAAAASIWGARAGNGVIVITTKRGHTAKPNIELNSNVTVQGRPDLFNVNTVSSGDYIDLEKWLFDKGHYSSVELDNLNGMGYPPLTPVIELLIAKRDGRLSAADADAQIEAFKKADVRSDTERYLYRVAVNQQYALNVSGSTPNINYYMSAGYDRNLYSLVGRSYDRISLRSQNSFKITKSLQADLGINFLLSTDKSGNNPGNGYISSAASKPFYPYASLVDDNGNRLPIYADYRKDFLMNAESRGLLNWEYNPINDIKQTENNDKIRDYLVTAGLRYKVTDFLNIETKYQFENQLSNGNLWYKEDSYYARNLINNFTQVNPANNNLTFPVPRGGILDVRNTELTSHQGRVQLNYNQNFGLKHDISAIAGYEIRSIVTTGNNSRSYGYNSETSTLQPRIDYISQFTWYSNQFETRMIENPQSIYKRTDNFLSYFTNAAYTYDGKYILSASLRKDQANLFGVATNQKGTPLWSVGGAWIISKEKFYNISEIPLLKLRASYGESGNISRKASAYSTAFYNPANTTPANTLTILTPPNEKLSWERIKMVNLGLDFQTRVIGGSIEYYEKKSNNLLGQAPLDPTLGLSDNSLQSFYYGNVAGINGKGVDIELNSRNLNGNIKWNTNLLFSYTKSTVSDYLMPVSSIGNIYLASDNSASINPVIGRPLFAMYSFPWAGLDPNTGDPMGIVNKNNSKDWNRIYTNTRLDSLIYNGSIQPTISGAFRNTFSWKNLSLSFNISYKLDYYFRKATLNYGSLFYSWSGNGDYSRRWQNPGDEKSTNIPSMVYPNPANRDRFYQYAEINVLKGDHIRLEDINISYNLTKKQLASLPVNNVRFYFYANNLGVIWKANKAGIDPYYNNSPLVAKRFSFGLNVNF